MENNVLEVRQQQELDDALIEADRMVMKKYMNHITDFPVVDLTPELKKEDLNSVFRLNKVEKIVYDANEDSLEKLMNVYGAVGMSGGSVVNIVLSDGENVEYYIGTRARDINNTATCQDVLSSAFSGNFQGSRMTLQKKGQMQECVSRVLGENRSVTVVTGVPGYRNENNKEGRHFVQGMERVIDSMHGKPFALVTIASPLDSDQIDSVRRGYENLYTQLSPFAGTTLSYSESDSNAVAQTITDGFTRTVGESVSSTISNSTSTTNGTNTSKSHTFNVPFVYSFNSTRGSNYSNSRQEGRSDSNSENWSDSDNHSKGQTDTYTSTTGRNLQIQMENKSVKQLMEKIEKMLARIDDSADLGLWNTATYCITDNVQTGRVLGNAMEALCRGEKNSIESFAVETWTNERKNGKVREYLAKMTHPVIKVDGNKGVFEVNPSSLINGRELVIEAGLPQKSVPGVPISEMIPFSRNVLREGIGSDSSVKLGSIYHMGSAESAKVELDVESLSAHTLITGSTGSGKSNTVYQMLLELKKHGVHFLVVEPAKGEYKNVFGNDSDVKVFGTNDRYTEMLKINPFKFPKTVHVLEHIDRLIEIFNVCWPMYAAMPAVLKDAVLCAYESCGWDLENSENEYGDNVYPSFKDLQRELIAVLNRSAYSDEVRGNYIGSLATRVRSLTNGINGRIFAGDDLSYEELFDGNVIIDLSRVGSTETKSLIMGIVVMALNEYRMDQGTSINDESNSGLQGNAGMNQPLRHVTVLEEAHNLLRNSSGTVTSSEEGGNLAGKSVEMIANSIAEMRTYGEGFIIVDQSPGAIDISAIRNTNTKIIMRLPEENDRRQAGKSAALKERQIDELAKLNRGVAVVYQNNWQDPVLCMIDKAEVKEQTYIYRKNRENTVGGRHDYTQLLTMLLKNRVNERLDFDLSRIEEDIEKSGLSTRTKLRLHAAVGDLKDGKEPELLQEGAFKAVSDIVVELLDCKDRLDGYAEMGDDCYLFQQELSREIGKNTKDISRELEYAVSQCLVREIVSCDESKVELYERWREFAIEDKKSRLA